MRAVLLAVLTLSPAIVGCLGDQGPQVGPGGLPEPEPWPAGQDLFHQDHRWKGGDGADTVRLGPDRFLWLFGDTQVEPEGTDRTFFLHNTVAIQNGSDPSQATFTAWWQTEAEEDQDDGPLAELPPMDEEQAPGQPTAFFPNESDEIWHWPGGGAMAGDRLVVLASRVQANGSGAFGFESAGWRIFTTTDTDRPPGRWDVQEHDPGFQDFGFLVDSAALVDGQHLYGYAHREVEREIGIQHEVAVVRWPLEAASRGRFDQAAWWTGAQGGWQADPDEGPAVLFTANAPSFTVHRDQGRGLITLTALESFPQGPVTVRLAEAPEGPFTRPRPLFTPPGQGEEDVGFYAARAHPGLTGADGIVTWHDNRYDRPRMAGAR